MGCEADMSLFRLVAREILYRKLNFALGVLSVVAAVGCLVAAVTLLEAHDARTEQIVAAKETEAKAQMDKLEDELRKIMKELGFNVLILPKAQNLGDLYAEDYADKTMPDSYADKLVQSKIMTVRHLLPILQQKIKWPERQRTILLVGTRGEVPLAHRRPREPMLNLVEPDTIVLGHELHRSLHLAVGDKVALLGHQFTVTKCHAERGTKDDITAWIHLGQAQELLRKRGLINGILALQCVCAQAELPKIRAEIQAILPDTQVVEFNTKVLVRFEARLQAKERARDTIAAVKRSRGELRATREAFAALLVPVVMVACIVWIGLLAFGNVRDRRTEIGILRALGVRSATVFTVFLTKAVVFGLCGALLGYFVGLAVGGAWSAAQEAGGQAAPGQGLLAQLFDLRHFVLVLVLAPVLACLASWLPAIMAARQDPAVVLTEA